MFEPHDMNPLIQVVGDESIIVHAAKCQEHSNHSSNMEASIILKIPCKAYLAGSLRGFSPSLWTVF